MHFSVVTKKCIRAVTAPFFRFRRKVSADVEEIYVKVKNLPHDLDGCRLAVVADLHLPDTLVDTNQLLTTLQSNHLDGILLAGDLFNRYNTVKSDTIATFLNALGQIAPTFAIAGNHEILSNQVSTYRTLLQDAQIPLLCDEQATFQCKGERLYVYGVCDCEKPLPHPPLFPTVLLAHHPEYAVKAEKNGFICAVCGHAHGGQVRFGKRGLFAPGQGFFPRYISGYYAVNGFPVIVSRGLGDSSLPVRLNNRPHLPVVVLLSE